MATLNYTAPNQPAPDFWGEGVIEEAPLNIPPAVSEQGTFSAAPTMEAPLVGPPRRLSVQSTEQGLELVVDSVPPENEPASVDAIASEHIMLETMRARDAWKSAIAARKATIAAMDADIAELHKEFTRLRALLKTAPKLKKEK